MANLNYTGIDRVELARLFEQERREWFGAGMSEADIYRMHFGDECDNGRGGDYRVWLWECARVRANRKYAPGAPVSLEEADPDGEWISAGRGALDDVDFDADLEAAMSMLTALQRTSFVEVRLNGRTQADVATELCVSRESVKQAIDGALKKLRKYFS